MSIKEQVEYAKEELTQDEKLLAGLIRIERFYKRNKMLILGLAAVVVVGGIGYGVMGYLKELKLEAANTAYLQLQAKPSDKKALEILRKENPALARLVTLKRAVAEGDVKTLKELEKSPDSVVADLAAYHVAALERDDSALNAYRLTSDALLKDYAAFDEAYVQMEKGNIAKGHELLSLIREDSPLKPVAKMLAHYGIATAAKGGE
ncbi:hypothetical protein [Hydrogenimonas sp. SS33]|uniref:hypothetical protein n=1 Tax=Hydrogenimonas leucolamina TaxID=2954236 RepID=UPI00336C24C0